ncbi:hypothetical protein SUGI_0537410 [Cryptomeria japonica]|uniref:homeobox-leucine zipper protein HAT22 n=1 Tax=Cryptomeria japonica TaxID=3369 RepID=UPI002408AF74|nr:homeobox-leucine zipper protein HAT22 [Cryptomeria japonica]GLJ27379.1 hypothetical protein SUGI_0537410 [Cryptomeria japonica]
MEGCDAELGLRLSIGLGTNYDDGLSSSSPVRGIISMKREREDGVTEEELGGSRVSDEEGNSTRKKLRLSKEQSALLEESFKQNSTLNPMQKQDLANQLNLRPRQVEVWFQNRRARTKLKQTEVDCEFLKKCYESLTEENRRLQKELAEMRALKLTTASSIYMQSPTPTLSMCPSCERVVGADKNGTSPHLPKQHFFPSYRNTPTAS